MVTAFKMPNPALAFIVCTPPPTILKAIVSPPAPALAELIASRREPAPLSLVLVTVNVAACAVGWIKRRR